MLSKFYFSPPTTFVKLFIFVVILFFQSTTAFSQIKLSWNVLADVEFEPQYFEEFGADYLVPKFGGGPSFYSGKEVLISGYLIPITGAGTLYVLSKNPYASCYFCGAAGPETIVELWMKPEAIRRYKMDERLTFKGVLQLNATDIQHCNYILKEAEEY